MELRELAPQLHYLPDTCNVYALSCDGEVVLIDFGNGRILRHLARRELGHVTNVLMTHHHRDQGQGLSQAVAAGIPIWAPHTEQDLFQHVDAHWQARGIMNDYNMRQDLFSLLESVPLAGTLKDYSQLQAAGHTFTILPTPGHTTGSITLLVDVDIPPENAGPLCHSERSEESPHCRLAFTGDLIAARGKVWSLAATQWSYNGAEGVAASILSLLSLKEHKPDVLLPSHGQPILDPQPAIDALIDRLWQLLCEREQNTELFELRDEPYELVTPHLLRNRTSMANSYVLRSESGKGLIFDFGYDYVVGTAAGTDRASRRPWLYTLDRLKERHDISEIEVVIPTHFHDDHVAGLNLLRDVEGAEVWAADSFADILQEPHRYNLPCLWYDPIPVDRVLPLQKRLRWQEYELTLHALPGHTRYAVAISLEVDGYRVLVSGDQYQGHDGLEYNYVYKNDFQIDDYKASADLYRRLNPDLILSGHWLPQWVQSGYFDALCRRGETLSQLHRQLLPEEIVNSDVGGFQASIRPYQSTIHGDQPLTLTVETRNPYDETVDALVCLVTPDGWRVEPAEATLALSPAQTAQTRFSVTPPQGQGVRRARLAANLIIRGQAWGQQAEALVTVQAQAPLTVQEGARARQ